MHPILIVVPQNVLKMYRSILHILLFKFLSQTTTESKKKTTQIEQKKGFFIQPSLKNTTKLTSFFSQKRPPRGPFLPPKKNDQNDDGLPVVSNHGPAIRQVPPAHRRGTAGLTWRNGTLRGASWEGADSHKNHHFFNRPYRNPVIFSDDD